MSSLEECLKITKSVVNAYNILENIAINYGINNKEFENIMSKIKLLVIREYKMYHSLNIDTIYSALEQFEDSDIELDTYSYRINNLLNNLLELKEEETYSYEDITSNNSNIKCNIKFLLSEIICTILELNILRIMENKTQEILNSKSYTNDYKNEYKNIHYNYLIYYFMVRNSSEIIGLNHNFDITKCPKLKIEEVINNLSIKYGSNVITHYEELRNGFIEMTIMTLNNLLALLKDKDSIEKDYQYQFYLTAIEVYINNLDSNRIKIISDYINNLAIEDKNIKNKLTRILKKVN